MFRSPKEVLLLFSVAQAVQHIDRVNVQTTISLPSRLSPLQTQPPMTTPSHPGTPSTANPAHITVLTDVNLPTLCDAGANATADVYYRPSDSAQPLLVLLPGALGDKAWYRGFASIVAEGAGVAVMVTQQLRDGPGGLHGNLVTKHVVAEAIAWARALGRGESAPSHLHIDLDRVALVGHSLGAAEVMAVMTGDSQDFVAPAEVHSAFLWGFTLHSPHSHWPTSHLVNARGPCMVMNGAGDAMSSDPANAAATFRQLVAPKAAAVLKDLDHFSIADRDWPTPGGRPKDTPSPLKRGDQAAAVAGGALAWLRAVRRLDRGEERVSVCEGLRQAGVLEPSALVSCEECLRA